MKIDDYELLIQLEKIGTVRGTAKAVLISQPAVSQRLKYMEDYFAEQIFVRTSKRLQLTPSGEMILQHAKKVVQHEHSIKNALAASSEEVRGTLSIASSSIISQRYLPTILEKFTKMFPLVSIDLVTGLSEDLKQNQSDYHVTIVRGPKNNEVTSKLLLRDPLYIFDTETFDRQTLKERPFISFKSDASLEETVSHWMYHHQDILRPIQNISVDQIETSKKLMQQGLGMAVLPKSVSDDLMETYPHLALTIDNKPVTRETWLCYQPDMRKLPQVNSFIELLLEESFQ
ncbi:MAG TPA: LysR family transcriptional regulator [Pseudogracilibacillus sp.]|nr:LysR family transcriptional regulator [Pseudogracilibacillus sp.]